MGIYINCYYETFIRKNKKREGYIGFIGKKVAFLPKNFRLPSYLAEGKYDILGKYIEDKGNYFIINKIELPSMYDVIGIPKNVFKNTNTTLLLMNNIPVKISNSYIEFEINNNKCRISLFQRGGNKRDVNMTLINVNGHLNVLNDTNPFYKNGQLNKVDFNEIVKILSRNYSSNTMLYLVSELMWLNEKLYQEVFEEEKEKNNNTNKENKNKNIIEELDSIGAYGNWSIGTYNLNIPIANEELYKIV